MEIGLKVLLREVGEEVVIFKKWKADREACEKAMESLKKSLADLEDTMRDMGIKKTSIYDGETRRQRKDRHMNWGFDWE